MKIYQDSNKKYFGLLYVQNEQAKGLPKNEPTWWFQPMQVKMRGRIPEGIEKVPGAWPVPLAENLVQRTLTEFTGSIKDVTVLNIDGAEPGPKTKIKKEETE